jgi:hypothetical protein
MLRSVGQALGTMRIISFMIGEGPRSPALGSVLWAFRQAITMARPETSYSVGYLNPVRPRSWLLSGIDEAVQRSVSSALDHYRDNGARIPDRSLDTGRWLKDDANHQGRLKTLAELHRRRRTLPPLAAAREAVGDLLGRAAPGLTLTPGIAPSGLASEA